MNLSIKYRNNYVNNSKENLKSTTTVQRFQIEKRIEIEDINFVKMSVLVYGAMLVLLSSPLVVLSNSFLNRVEVIRHNGSLPSADAFSNPGCQARYCEDQGTHCYTGACCKCQCPNNKANYIVNKWKCLSRNELKQLSSTNCKYSILKPDQALLGIPLTEVMAEKVIFVDTSEHQTLIPCNQSLQISWEYRDAFGEWKEPNVNGNIQFKANGYTKNGEIRDQRVVQDLTWTGKLNSNYAGLLIRFSFKCEGVVQGCALAKITGQHTYDTTKLSTVRPPPVIPTTTATSPPETTTISHQNTNEYQKDNENQASTKGNPAAIFGPILGVLGMICLIGVICVVAAKYRKRRRDQDRENNSVAKLEEFEYQDPIYADINKGDFDNPAYCDPTDPAIIKAHLGPLPKTPGSESAYEPLNSLTRTCPDYDNPVKGVNPEVDYDNPPVGMQNTNDYDNPPVKDGTEYTGDYDNPPVKDGKGNTGDYDNPPVGNAAEINQDYDNPTTKNDDDTTPTDNAQSDTDEDTFF